MGAQRITDLTSLAGGRGPATQHSENQTRSLTARGTVAIAPAAEADAMVCVVESLSGVQPVTIPSGNWAPRGTTLPAVGATCLVVYDDQGDAFVPNWEGTTTFTEINGVMVPLTTSAWIAPTLLNSWANYGSGYETVGYLKDPLGFVHLKGSLASGASATVAFVLPTGYRPGANMEAIIVTNGAAATVPPGATLIQPGGNVSIYGTSAPGYASLSGITFLAEN